MELNESPVFLLLDTTTTTSTTRGNTATAGAAAATDELPVSLFESELHVVDGNPSFTFVQASFTIATEEAERIGVDQVSKLLPSGNAAGSNQCKEERKIYIYTYFKFFLYNLY
jgi:COP9 signalosome complex subunit 6